MVADVLIDAVPPVLGAVVAGGVIGLEREWRGRAAGFRTHILVSLASALLMLAALSQADWAFRALPNETITTDPTRMAHGVLTGIGFLCAGVIFRTGFSVHGLTTAASLWITSAIGLLFGVGLYGLGALGTVVTAAILGGLRLIDQRLPGRTVIDAVVCWERREPSPEAAVQAALRTTDADVRPGRFEMTEDGRARRTWRLKAASETDLQRLAEQLGAVPGVTGYRLDPRDD
ncbi:MAG: MgtC/SapB family protein [Alphaproteobacteria bacterium]|jgi:putative Mg2+ transporter-C (MgtC) family protein|uniref:Protein MgtC n=1 Tax=Brevundimonas mediterranea TaxID=74329 RepID=A0A6G7EG35_9CAUL|nr:MULTISPECIES: MgtC/SapB family protein [Brevundimonas]MBU1272221.1 MgtC/SapB family protein [Alphaproteobacteria bacterium]OGN42776.1 MAG: magnesium transporter [Caulobacterales bacterium GWE1_67_11]OGN47863.1 MAG: magnesium transporter [Caulobacterales bacterium RIFCSPHIGHO2_01_FULL_67_30]OGN48617.1 MAG: magnesium transporter [Caulobacterales bacterium RIFCSPHIGHO2_12_FULL_68_13]OYX76101.1 MAG: magnesium transporter [Brevundimonas sp. 32-68-21]